LVTDGETWNKLNSPGYCWYNNQTQNGNTYGALYNWYIVNTGKLCPKGWHVPSDVEWKNLTEYLGGSDVAGGKLKETGTAHWNRPNTGATNETGFTALPGGVRHYIGTFAFIGSYGAYWSASESSTDGAWDRTMTFDYSGVYRGDEVNRMGISVRCVRD